MQYFWEQSKLLEPIFRKANKIHLFLDFDGTLSPLVSTPARAKLPKYTKILLEQLVLIDNVTFAIISGRGLDDVKEKINISGIFYSGSHGMEWELNGRRFATTIPTKITLLLKEIKDAMIKISQIYKGSHVEDKTFSVAFHYRRVAASKKVIIEELLHKQLSKYLETNLVSLLFSNETYEMRARLNWTKGDMVLHYKKLQHGNTSTIIYIGDSVTDEDAFKKLRRSITIKVGTRKAYIDNYFIINDRYVLSFLSCFIYVIS
ncbi:MAG: trehalose-phosphatase [Candidatus Levybacteria bacterium]|nr:trehalose-phosphatase [Candidatus Levybacteria bacterium]